MPHVVCACPKSGVLWSVVCVSPFDLLVNSHKLILCGVHRCIAELFCWGNSELATWCGFPLYWRPCFDLWIICCSIQWWFLYHQFLHVFLGGGKGPCCHIFLVGFHFLRNSAGVCSSKSSNTGYQLIPLHTQLLHLEKEKKKSWDRKTETGETKTKHGKE